MKTIEEKVASTILQEEARIAINGRNYEIRPILSGTLIRISALISTLPPAPEGADNGTLLKVALSNAGYIETLAEIAAVGVLNRKSLNPIYEKNKLPWLSKKMVSLGVKELKDDILYSLSSKEISSLIMEMIGRSGVSNFFGVMVSLGGVNLLKETMNQTTAFGQLSEE